MKTSTFLEAWAIARAIDGWLAEEQARALWALSAATPADSWIVEIGSHHGRSTVVLALAKPPQTRMLAIDPFDDARWGGGEPAHEAISRNLAKAALEGDVEVFRGTSKEALRDRPVATIGLLFVDGAHDRRSVLTDIDGWEPRIVEGGIACFHDAFSAPGVTGALLQRHLASRRFRLVASVRTLAIFRREDLSATASVANSAAVVSKVPYFARNVAVKLAQRRGWRGVVGALGHHDEGPPY
jgi:predicted O-methyltransferase YrrM